MNKLSRTDLFYVGLLIFAIALPFSVALISIAAVLLLVLSIIAKKQIPSDGKLYERKYLLLPLFVYLVHIFAFLFCKDLNAGVYDLRKAAPFLLIPMSFFWAPKLTPKKLRAVLQVFVLAVFLSAIITFLRFHWADNQPILAAQSLGFIHHIRFSLMIVLALIIQAYLLSNAKIRYSLKYRIGSIPIALFLLYFLFWLQSLTGIITFLGVVLISIVRFSFGYSNNKLRLVLSLVLIALVAVPSAYLYRVVRDFYTTDEVNFEKLPTQTALGNAYQHDFDNPLTENGHFVGLYVCETELREEWNKRSLIDFDGSDENEYRVRDTLIRYLSSRNLTKDAAGMAQLSDEEIQLIESGISNHMLATKRLSLYPRLYVSVWEIDNYLKTGNANHKSLAQRIEYYRAAWSIWQDHFWFGVGTGNWKAAYSQAYQEMGSEMAEDQYGDAHNQYLAWLVRFGLIGTLVILLLLAVPIIQSGMYRNGIGLAFVILLIISNFGDSNLDTHVGGYFFILFYCLFLTNIDQLDLLSSQID